MLKQKIKELFAEDCSGHDYWHNLRVLNNAEKIAKTEKCDEYMVMIACRPAGCDGGNRNCAGFCLWWES